MFFDFFFVMLFFMAFCAVLGYYFRSTSFFIIAAGIAFVGFMLVGDEGISYPTGYSGLVNQETYDFNTSQTFNTENPNNSLSAFAWHWLLFGCGVVWFAEFLKMADVKSKVSAYYARRRRR